MALTDLHQHDSGNRAAGALRWAGVIGIVSIAILRCLTVFSPDPIFGTDPVLDPLPRAGLGPVGGLTLDAVLLISCACGLLGECLLRRGIEWKLFLLALLPAPVILWHGVSDFGDLWRGLTWAAGAIAAVSSAHLARDRTLRLVMLALLASVTAPLLVRGIVQVLHEHPQMVAFYRADPQRVLLARGIEPASAAALIFERRVAQAEATGWFGLANVFGSLMLFGLIVSIGGVIGAIRGRLAGGWCGLLALFALGCGSGLVFSRSKGAMAAALLGLAILTVPALAPVARERLRRWGGWLAIGAVALPLLAVAVRGAVLSEGFLDDRSILFRWHYVVASARIIAESPLTGVGPDDFQQAYVLHRPAANPEEVSSAHSIFVDWIATLGLSGVALLVMVLVLAWRAGLVLAERDDSHPDVDADEHSRLLKNASLSRRSTHGLVVVSVLLVTLLGLVPALYIEVPALDVVSFLLRLVGFVAFIGIALGLGRAAASVAGRIVLSALAAAGIAFLAHSQIEMSMTHPGVTVWGFAVLGIAGAGRMRAKPRSGSIGVIAPVVLLLAAIGLAVVFIRPAIVQRQLVESAAAPLQHFGQERVRSDVNQTSERQWEEGRLRRRAADLLVQAYASLPSNVRPLMAASEQSAASGAILDGEEREESLRRAAALADRAAAEHPEPATIALQARAWEALAALTRDERALSRAIEARQMLADLDPHGLQTRLALADLLWKAGRRDEAAQEYQLVLQLNENWYLDPLKQLSAAEVERISQRLQSQ